MTNAREEFEKRMTRLHARAERIGRLVDHELEAIEKLYVASVAEMESEKERIGADFRAREEKLRASVDAAGKDYQLDKYRMEKDTAAAKADQELIDGESIQVSRRTAAELVRIGEEKTEFEISWARQKSALEDLYQEKKRHLLVTRAALLQETQAAEAKMKKATDKAKFELDQVTDVANRSLNAVTQQADAKKQGWTVARETLRRELDTIIRQLDRRRRQRRRDAARLRDARALGRGRRAARTRDQGRVSRHQPALGARNPIRAARRVRDRRRRAAARGFRATRARRRGRALSLHDARRGRRRARTRRVHRRGGDLDARVPRPYAAAFSLKSATAPAARPR